LESSIEIKELESKLRMAYILKERQKQIDEKVSARIYEQVRKKISKQNIVIINLLFASSGTDVAREA
jgi:hypothetical protein